MPTLLLAVASLTAVGCEWEADEESCWSCSFCVSLWLRFSVWLSKGWRVSVNDIQREFILQKISDERDTDLLYCLESRINYHHNKCLLSSSVGVCVQKCVLVLVRLWEAVWAWDIWWEDSFTKWGYFESFSQIYNFFNQCVIVVSIFMAGWTETLKNVDLLQMLSAIEKCWSGLSGPPVQLTVPMLSNFISSLNDMFESDALLTIFSLHKRLRRFVIFVLCFYTYWIEEATINEL